MKLSISALTTARTAEHQYFLMERLFKCVPTHKLCGSPYFVGFTHSSCPNFFDLVQRERLSCDGAQSIRNFDTNIHRKLFPYSINVKLKTHSSIEKIWKREWKSFEAATQSSWKIDGNDKLFLPWFTKKNPHVIGKSTLLVYWVELSYRFYISAFLNDINFKEANTKNLNFYLKFYQQNDTSPQHDAHFQNLKRFHRREKMRWNKILKFK